MTAAELGADVAWARFAVRPQSSVLREVVAEPSLPSGRRTLPVPVSLRHALGARVTVVVDMDCLSHLDERTSVLDHVLAGDLEQALGAAAGLGPVDRRRYASSSVTARTHLDLFCAMPNNVWTIGYGLDGADAIVGDELATLARAPGRSGPRAVVLVATDHAYANAVAYLAELGVPTWLLVPRHGSAAFVLRRAARAVGRLGGAGDDVAQPRRPAATPGLAGHRLYHRSRDTDDLCRPHHDEDRRTDRPVRGRGEHRAPARSRA